jgi:hypothetical protein
MALAAAALTVVGAAANPRPAEADYDFAAPTLISASLDGTAALVTFRDNSSAELGYGISAHRIVAEAGTSQWVEIPPVPGIGRERTATVTGLETNTTYCFTAVALGPYGDYLTADSPQSNEICVRPAAPASPVLSSVAVDGPNSLKVTWTDESSDESSFLVNVYQGGTLVKSPPSAGLPGSGGTGTATVTGLESGRRYCVAVAAVSVNGVSADSAQQCATMPGFTPAMLSTGVVGRVLTQAGPAAAAPAAPSGFAGQRDALGVNIILHWDLVTSADYYFLTASSHRGGTPLALTAPAPRLGGGTTSFMVDGTAAQVQGGADFALQACNAAGCSSRVTISVP